MTTEAKATLPQRAVHEFRSLVILTAYLYVTLGSVIVMKAAVLHTQGIDTALWGVAIVKALVLAKFILVGHAMKIGQRSHGRPLIWPTMHMAFAFLLLLIVLTTGEEAIVGLIHGVPVADSLGDLYGRRLYETLAGFLIMLMVLIPYFAVRVLGETLGENRLARMFFVDPEPQWVRQVTAGRLR